jgi:hypothetical protein
MSAQEDQDEKSLDPSPHSYRHYSGSVGEKAKHTRWEQKKKEAADPGEEAIIVSG